jgi:hypothetical protein
MVRRKMERLAAVNVEAINALPEERKKKVQQLHSGSGQVFRENCSSGDGKISRATVANLARTARMVFGAGASREAVRPSRAPRGLISDFLVDFPSSARISAGIRSS